MKGVWPGDDGQERSDEDITRSVMERQWPKLERVYLGEVVRKCWDYEYRDVAELKRDLVGFLAGEGWEVDGEDELRGFRERTELRWFPDWDG